MLILSDNFSNVNERPRSSNSGAFRCPTWMNLPLTHVCLLYANITYIKCKYYIVFVYYIQGFLLYTLLCKEVFSIRSFRKPKAARILIQVIFHLVIILCLLQTIITFFPSLTYLRMPLFIVMIILASISILTLFIAFRCPNCGKLLNYWGDKQRICHRCGFRLYL